MATRSVFKLSLPEVERLVRARAAVTGKVRLTNHVLAHDDPSVIVVTAIALDKGI